MPLLANIPEESGRGASLQGVISGSLDFPHGLCYTVWGEGGLLPSGDENPFTRPSLILPHLEAVVYYGTEEVEI